MERVGSQDHPLSSTIGEPSNATSTRTKTATSRRRQTYSYSDPGQPQPPEAARQQQQHQQQTFVARSPAASLIQSAARSALLDDATPNSTVISDDASEASSSHYYHPQHHQFRDSPAALQSLQTQTLPALPDEQDRRRFIGCLAAVLASSYEFDQADDGTDIPSTAVQGSSITENVWLGYPDEFWDDDDDDFDDDVEEKLDDTKAPASSSSRSKTFSNSRSSTASDSMYSSRCHSFESIGTQDSASSSATTTTTGSKIRRGRRRRQTESAAALRSSSSMFRNNDKEKAKLSRERHRHRRYEVLSKLLMSSSELLLLDKTVARAFLPMLSRVLVPQCQKTMSGHNPAPRSACNKGITSTSSSSSRSAPSSPTQGLEYKASVTNMSALNSSFDVDRLLSSTTGGRSKKTEHANMSSEDVKSAVDHPLPAIPLDNEEELRPFLDSLTPGAGFRCVSLLLLQHLLTSEVGYDARIRHVLKKLGVIVLVHDMERDPVERRQFSASYPQFGKSARKANNPQRSRQEMMLQATRKFEALEHSLAQRLLRLSTPGQNRESNSSTKNDRTRAKSKANNGTTLTREQIVRGVKIGGAGLVAGTLFALTGGLAAPGIAAGVAAVAGAAAGTAAVATLTSAAVVTTIFGVGGGGLAAYKMQRRTQGVTEFEFNKETDAATDYNSGIFSSDRGLGGHNDHAKSEIEAELFSVLCISGWLRDRCDYQRPWGLQPTNPRIYDRQELLERFYSIHSPDHVPKCARILSSWKGEEHKLWQILREKYGCDPDSIFPVADGPRVQGALTLEQEEVLDKLFVELGYNSVAPEREEFQHEKQPSPFEKMRLGWKNRMNSNHVDTLPVQYSRYDSTHGPSADTCDANYTDSMLYSYEASGTDDPEQEETIYHPPKHLSTVWDWKMTYGGEMYTVKWESELLKQICDCFIDLAMDVVSGATKQLLKQTVFHTLLSAVVWPSYLLNVANMIDGDWTLAVERADEAGKALAKTLLFSRAGRRPVTLVGYSFGSRIIYSCLKELARYQEEWETYQELLEEHDTGGQVDRARLSKYGQKMKGMREPASIIEDAVLMGLPNHLSLASWRACRQVVAGRLVNCYSRKDLILSLMFQAKRFSGASLSSGMGSILKPVCGTCPVEEPGVENIDCSDLILGHQDYCLETGKILERIRFGQPMRCRTNAALSVEDVTGTEYSLAAKKLTY